MTPTHGERTTITRARVFSKAFPQCRALNAALNFINKTDNHHAVIFMCVRACAYLSVLGVVRYITYINNCLGLARQMRQIALFFK